MTAVFTLAASGDLFLMRRLTDVGLPVAYVPVAWVSLQLLKGLFNVPGGRASDRYGRRRVLALAWLLYAATYLCFGFVQSWWAGWLLLLPYALLTHEGAWALPDGTGLLALVVLCVVHTGFGCYLYFSSMQGLSAQTIAICGYIDPLCALLFAAAFLGERLSAPQWLGAALILGGALLAQLYKQKQ